MGYVQTKHGAISDLEEAQGSINIALNCKSGGTLWRDFAYAALADIEDAIKILQGKKPSLPEPPTELVPEDDG